MCVRARWLVICVKPPSQPPGPLSHLLLPVSSPSALWGSFSWLQRACVSPHAACWPLTLYTSLSRLSVSFYMFYAQWMTPISSALYWCVCERDSPYFNLIHSQTSKVRNRRQQLCDSVRFLFLLIVHWSVGDIVTTRCKEILQEARKFEAKPSNWLHYNRITW